MGLGNAGRRVEEQDGTFGTVELAGAEGTGAAVPDGTGSAALVGTGRAPVGKTPVGAESVGGVAMGETGRVGRVLLELPPAGRARMRSEARSETAMIRAEGLVLTMPGKTEASTTKS